jgi:translation initiation factor IF-1
MGKGRITASRRKDINNSTVESAMHGESEDVFFGRVLKHLGAGHVRVILENKREGIAKIRTVLTKRGSTPIVTDDIVVLSGRDFETKKPTVGADGKLTEKEERYDLLGVLSRAQAAKMEKEGKIPPWFVASDAEEGGSGEGFMFDYTETKEEEVNVDEI